MADAIPLVCSLTDAQFREREATLLRQFRLAVTVFEELPNGYSCRVPGDKNTIILLAELIAAERECCRFLSFELRFESDLGPILVAITGPDGSKNLIKSFLT